MVCGKDIFVPINELANHAAEILINNPENARSHGRYFFFRILTTEFAILYHKRNQETQ